MKVERHHIKGNDEIVRLCRLSKDLFNKANYIIRGRFFRNEKLPDLTELVALVHQEPAFQGLHNTKTAKQTLRKLKSDWSNFFKSLAAYKKDKTGYLKAPKPPGYKKRMAQVIFYNETIRKKPIAQGRLVPTNDCFAIESNRNFNQVVITPKSFGFIIDVSYEEQTTAKLLTTKGDGICSIDFGVNNLCAITSDKHSPILVNGRILKSINRRYNKRRNKQTSRKRYFQIENYFHHTANYIIDLCLKNRIGTIILGCNKGWKQNGNIGKKNNQNFQSIPFFKLKQKIKYRAEYLGIQVIETEESYTSQASYLDRDSIPAYKKGAPKPKFSGKRISRGLYQAANGRIINADINGSANIARKVIRNVEILDRLDRSLAARPVRINPLKAFRPNASRWTKREAA